MRHLAPHPQEGQGLVEYAIILILVAMVVLVILIFVGPQVGNLFSRVTNAVSAY